MTNSQRHWVGNYLQDINQHCLDIVGLQMYDSKNTICFQVSYTLHAVYVHFDALPSALSYFFHFVNISSQHGGVI